VQEMPHDSISLTVSSAMGCGYLNAIRVRYPYVCCGGLNDRQRDLSKGFQQPLRCGTCCGPLGITCIEPRQFGPLGGSPATDHKLQQCQYPQPNRQQFPPAVPSIARPPEPL